MLFTASCSKDENLESVNGNLATVTFNVGVEGGLVTRAISDGLSAKKLICAVYDVNNNLLSQSVINGSTVNADGQFVKADAFANGLTDNVTARLAKGQTYTMVFWAQSKDCTAYTTTDLTDISISYVGNNNDEKRDAFFAAETFKVDGDTEIDVTLKRPFAQINVGVTKEDWDAAVGSGVEIKESKVVIKNAATSINLLDGSVDGATKVEYSFATIPYQFTPSETLDVDTDSDGTKEKYMYLSMSYILVNDESNGSSKATLESEGLQFTFSPESGNDIFFFEGLNNVPVQRNWRTNIIGKILTGNVTFNITIDPIYNGEYNYPNTENKVGLNGTYYATIEDALNDANDDDVIYVGEDTYTNLPSITKKVTLICEEGTVFEGKQGFNIAGSTIVGATFQSGSDELVSYYSTINGTFKDCTFNGDLKYSYAGETVVFENCEFNGPDYAIHFDSNASGATNTKVILKNCVINSDWRVAIGGAISMFEATDCKFNVDGFINMWGKAKLTNCEFKKPIHWICSMDYTEYTNCMYDGRALTADDIRIKDTIIKVNGEYYASASNADAFAKIAESATGDVKIVLASDITFGNATEPCNAVKFANATSVTIDGNNHEITFKGKAPYNDNPIDDVAGILTDGTITVKNVTLVNEKLSVNGTKTAANRGAVYTTIRGASVAYENVIFEGGVQVKGNETFTNCSFTENVLTTDAEGYASDGRFCMFIDHEYDTTGEWEVKLENCTFDASGYGCVKVAGDNGAKITVDVKGCSFTNTCPSNSWSKLVPKYDVKATGDNITVNDLGGNTWAKGLAN